MNGRRPPSASLGRNALPLQGTPKPLSMLPSGPEAKASESPLAAGLEYASGRRLGVAAPVLPLEHGTKRPHHGLGRLPDGLGGVAWATCDVDRVTWWFNRWPDAGLGLGLRGLAVVDIEGESKGHDAAETAAALIAAGLSLPPTRTHGTPGGGWHLLYRLPPGLSVRGRTLLPTGAAELKAAGQYVVAPPTTLAGGAYSILNARPPAPVPSWICAPPPTPRPLPPAPQLPVGVRFTSFGRSALSGLLHDLEGTQRQRHTAIYRAAARFGALEQVGHVDPSLFWRVKALAGELFPTPRSRADDLGIARALERGRADGRAHGTPRASW